MTTYDLLVVGELEPLRLRVALARMAGVAVEDVDVAPAESTERRWDALVLCGFEPVSGDVSYALDVYLAEQLPRPAPDVFTVAATVAAELGVVVLYSAQPYPPSAHWLVTPEGTRVRARVYDAEPVSEDDVALVIDAVERPIALLPGVHVQPLPDVIREHRMATPIADGFEESLTEKPRVGDALWRACDHLAVWEAFVARMSAGWPPDGWYPAEYREEDLGYRDRLAEDVTKVPEAVAGRFGVALADVDSLFRAGTREDPDAPAELAWWRRRVVDLGVPPGS